VNKTDGDHSPRPAVSSYFHACPPQKARFQKELKGEGNELPVVIIGNRILVGETKIRKELEELVNHAGFSIVKFKFFNMAGVFTWFLMSKILRWRSWSSFSVAANSLSVVTVKTFLLKLMASNISVISLETSVSSLPITAAIGKRFTTLLFGYSKFRHIGSYNSTYISRAQK
jgi:hypothetical protein